MKKITMFVEELSDDYSVLPFYPVKDNQDRLRSQINKQKQHSFEDGMQSVIEFIDNNPAPAAGATLAIEDAGDDGYRAGYQVPETVEPPKNELIPQGSGRVDIPVRSSIDASDITVTPDGCIINRRFLPADLLLAAASAVHQYQMENE